MAKFKVKYPNGVDVTKYVTTDVGPSEETSGRTIHQGGARVYYKPSLGGVVWRKAGVNRRSNVVREINKKLEGVKGKTTAPAAQCGGRPWKDFVSCLKGKMKETLKDYTVEPEKPITLEKFEAKEYGE